MMDSPSWIKEMNNQYQYIDHVYINSFKLLKYVAKTYGLNIELDKPFNIDGYWAHYPCEMDKNKWPVGVHNIGPNHVRVDYQFLAVSFLLNKKEVRVVWRQYEENTKPNG